MVINDSIEVIRLSVYLSLSFLVIYSLMKWINGIRGKIALIDSLPGPTSFSCLLGNIPFEILTHVGSSFEDSKDLYYNLMQAVHGYTHVFQKDRIYRLWLAWEPWVVLWKPESVEQVLSNNFLLEKSSQYDFLHPWLGTGLLTSGGKKWRMRRKMLVPAFHFKILHDFVPVFNEHASFLVKKLQTPALKGKEVDVVPVVTACALDIICGERKREGSKTLNYRQLSSSSNDLSFASSFYPLPSLSLLFSLGNSSFNSIAS